MCQFLNVVIFKVWSLDHDLFLFFNLQYSMFHFIQWVQRWPKYSQVGPEPGKFGNHWSIEHHAGVQRKFLMDKHPAIDATNGHDHRGYVEVSAIEELGLARDRNIWKKRRATQITAKLAKCQRSLI